MYTVCEIDSAHDGINIIISYKTPPSLYDIIYTHILLIY
jgi:hypothetical protein